LKPEFLNKGLRKGAELLELRSRLTIDGVRNNVRPWLKTMGPKSLYIEPASTWENGYFIGEVTCIMMFGV